MKIATSTRYKQHRRNTLPRTQISTYIAMAETREELQDSLLKRDEEIRNLNSFLQLKKNQLQQREEEIQQLRSHLDKFQSVLPLVASRQTSHRSRGLQLVSPGRSELKVYLPNHRTCKQPKISITENLRITPNVPGISPFNFQLLAVIISCFTLW